MRYKIILIYTNYLTAVVNRCGCLLQTLRHHLSLIIDSLTEVSFLVPNSEAGRWA